MPVHDTGNHRCTLCVWGADMNDIGIIDTIMDQAEERMTGMKKVSGEMADVSKEVIKQLESGELDVANGQLVWLGFISSVLLVILGHLEEMNESEEREEK